MQRACKEAMLPLVRGKIKYCKKKQWCIGLALLLLPTFLVKTIATKSRTKRKWNGKTCPCAVGLHKPPPSQNAGDLPGKALQAVEHWERRRSLTGCLESKTEPSLEDHNVGVDSDSKATYLFGYAPSPSVRSHAMALTVKILGLLRLSRSMLTVWRVGRLKQILLY